MLPAVTGHKHPRDPDDSAIPAAKEARLEPSIDYQDGCAVLLSAKACLEQLHKAAMISLTLKQEWMKKFIQALQPELNIDSARCQNIANTIFAHLFKTPFTAQVKERTEYKQLSKESKRGLSELFREVTLFCDWSLEDFVAELQKLANNAFSLEAAVEAFYPFVARKTGDDPKEKNVRYLFQNLISLFRDAPSFTKDLRVQECIQKLLPIWRNQLLELSENPGEKQSIEQQYQKICYLYQIEKQLSAKLPIWISNPLGSLSEIQFFLSTILWKPKLFLTSKTLTFWTERTGDTKKTKPACLFQPLLQLSRQRPEILENEQIRSQLPKLIAGLWEVIKRMPYSSSSMFGESAAAASLLKTCDPNFETPPVELQFEDNATETLDYASAEALCALSQPFAGIREDKSPKGLPIPIPFTKAQFDAFYRILWEEKTFDPSIFIENLYVADFFACNSFIDCYFKQIKKFLCKKKYQSNDEMYSALETLCLLNDSLVIYPAYEATEMMKKWEKLRDIIFSHLINWVPPTKTGAILLTRMAKLLQESRTQKWPCTLYLAYNNIDEAILIHFNELLKDVTRIVINTRDSSFKKVNELLQKTPNLRQLETSDKIDFSQLAQHCPGLESLVIEGRNLYILKESFPHLKHLVMRPSWFDSSSIHTIFNPFDDAKPNLETFEVHMNFNGTLSFHRSQGIATISCTSMQFAKLQQSSFFLSLHQKFPFVKEILVDIEGPPARYNLISQGPDNVRLIPFAIPKG